MKTKGMKIDTFEYHLNAFEYGVPPHAGCGIGLERLMMALTGTENIRDTTFYPRDVDRLTPQVKNLVTEEEIAQVAKLMKIEIEDHSEHVEKVQKMLQYFDILDEANVESEKLEYVGIEMDELRDDSYTPYDKKLLKFLKTYKEKYIKAPKLS